MVASCPLCASGSVRFQKRKAPDATKHLPLRGYDVGCQSADGVLYTCLFATAGHDLRGPMRAGVSDRELDAEITSVWGSRADRYSELRSAATADLPKIEMSYIGG